MLARYIGVGIACLGFVCACNEPRETDRPTGETGSIPEQFERWAHEHAHELDVSSMDHPLGDARLQSFASLRQIVGDARVLGIGEPGHASHEPLAMRNLVIRYLVSELGFTAVALETGLSPSKRLYDYVLNKRDEADSALAAAFSYGFGEFQENLELLHWLRDFNAKRPPANRVRLYGVDMTGQVFPTAYRSLDAVMGYLDGADRALASRVRADLADVLGNFRIDRFYALPTAEQIRINIAIDDLITLLRKRRNDLTMATSRDDYDWALRQAVSAGHDVAYMRLAPKEWATLFARPGEPSNADASLPERHALHAVMEVREASIAENLGWILEREGRQGRVVLFTHNLHLQAHPLSTPEGQGFTSLLSGLQFAGVYIRSMLGRDLVVIGQHFGVTPGFPNDARPSDAAPLDAVLSFHRVPAYVIDLRALPAGSPLGGWFDREQATRYPDYESKTIVQNVLRPSRAYNAILYIDRVTPARR